jgi:hypothetical protein
MVKTFKVSIKASEEVNANNMDEAFSIACKLILHDVGITTVTEEILTKMEERFTYNVAGKKE